MRIAVIGLGIQGNKRSAISGDELVATIDPVKPEADFKRIEDVPLDSYDAALACLPDDVKVPILTYLLENGKHVLVEKPLISDDDNDLLALKNLAEKNNVVCYTAYNHRFEPHILKVKELLDSGDLGQVYRAKFFYGNGTARDVRNSEWRDKGMGVFPDLGSHLLDWTLQLFGKPNVDPEVWSASCHENRAYDHFNFGFKGDIFIDYEMTLLMWRNSFRFDLFAENGSVHIDCLCKWGPSKFAYRKRKLPSGRPDEENDTLECADPTWQLEYDHFKKLCENPTNNIDNDIWINGIFRNVEKQLS